MFFPVEAVGRKKWSLIFPEPCEFTKGVGPKNFAIQLEIVGI